MMPYFGLKLKALSKMIRDGLSYATELLCIEEIMIALALLLAHGLGLCTDSQAFQKIITKE